MLSRFFKRPVDWAKVVNDVSVLDWEPAAQTYDREAEKTKAHVFQDSDVVMVNVFVHGQPEDFDADILRQIFSILFS